jgi:Uma2 family endonuclease
MSNLPDPELLREALIEADEHGYRLEIVNGLGIWEVQPGIRHVRKSRAIERSIKPAPGREGAYSCANYADLYIVFPDSSLRRPDIAVFCREPDETDGAVHLVPEAVVEVVSRGSELKDLTMNPGFYLGHGVKDVVVVDPYTDQVYHHRAEEVKHLSSPADILLECGCLVSV